MLGQYKKKKVQRNIDHCLLLHWTVSHLAQEYSSVDHTEAWHRRDSTRIFKMKEQETTTSCFQALSIYHPKLPALPISTLSPYQEQAHVEATWKIGVQFHRSDQSPRSRTKPVTCVILASFPKWAPSKSNLNFSRPSASKPTPFLQWNWSTL